ncbi:MAG: signal recognition particle receptor subunit alpha, partial [Bacilli bacterium]|nr:signal recognition particle receptor subunit alpha [Bacilli bacterium]
MFENLGERLQKALKNIRGYGKITEDNISDIMREVRMALLEADVNYQVVKEFTNKVKEKALGEEVRKSLSPSEMFVTILKDELINLLGVDKATLKLDKQMNIYMLAGLQGSGKTTTVGKLGNYLRKKYKKKPIFIACDVYRPAAIDQL